MSSSPSMSSSTEEFEQRQLLQLSKSRTAATEADIMQVELDGYAGPLDLLLDLARNQKVDLTKISILALAEQYLAYIRKARDLKLDLAADYLVMAAWLAYLKSRLLLPEPEPDPEAEPTAEELARHLAHRLRRLEAMREAAKALWDRPQLGRDIFPRGMPEPVNIRKDVTYDADLYDLLRAYADRRNREAVQKVTIRKRPVWSIKQARQRLEELLDLSLSWAPLDHFIILFATEPEQRRSATASSFAATLEMAREGWLELRQSKAFAPLYVKKKANGKKNET